VCFQIQIIHTTDIFWYRLTTAPWKEEICI